MIGWYWLVVVSGLSFVAGLEVGARILARRLRSSRRNAVAESWPTVEEHEALPPSSPQEQAQMGRMRFGAVAPGKRRHVRGRPPK